MFRIAVLASGRGSNLEALIKAQKVKKTDAEIALVVSDNPKAEALPRATGHGIPTQVVDPTIYTEKKAFDQALLKLLQSYQVDLIALAGYMRLVPPELLQAFPNRVINIHPSLLPAFPGMNAQQQAWDYGVKFTGCTVHFVDEGMDTGPIIAQTVVPVLTEDTLTLLTNRILKEEHLLYPRVVQWIAEGRIKLLGRKVFIK